MFSSTSCNSTKILINIEDLILELLTTIENRWNCGCLLSYLGEWWQSNALALMPACLCLPRCCLLGPLPAALTGSLPLPLRTACCIACLCLPRCCLAARHGRYYCQACGRATAPARPHRSLSRRRPAVGRRSPPSAARPRRRKPPGRRRQPLGLSASRRREAVLGIGDWRDWAGGVVRTCGGAWWPDWVGGHWPVEPWRGELGCVYWAF